MTRQQILLEINQIIDDLKLAESLEKRQRLGDLLKLLKYKDEIVPGAVFKEYLLAFGTHYSEENQFKDLTQKSLNDWSELLKPALYLFSEE